MGKTLGEELYEDFIKIKKKRLAFFESDRFNNLYDIISGEDEIHGEKLYRKEQTVEGLTPEDFGYFCSSLFEARAEKDGKVSDKSLRMIDCVEYKDIRLTILLRQGGWKHSQRLDR